MDKTSLIILSILLPLTLYFIVKDKKEYENFKQISNTKERQNIFKRWIIESLVLFGLTSIVGLLLINEISYLYEFPSFLEPISQKIIENNFTNNFVNGILKLFTRDILLILILVPPISTLIKVYISVKNSDSNSSEQADFRNLNALYPQNSDERKWMSLVSINAGVVEELFFRLFVPVLIYQLTNSVLIAILGSTLWFGIAHLYQGVSGIMATIYIGFLFFFIYLFTKSIFISIFFHSILNLNGAVLEPWFKEYLKKKKNSL